MSDAGLIRLSTDTYHDVKASLKTFISSMAAAGERRLPAEEQLSIRLGVSRPTVRSALLSLQKEGLLERAHGRGTFLNKHAVQIQSNLAEDKAFVDLITDLGHVPSISTVIRGIEPLVHGMSEKLERPTGSSAIVLERLFMASGSPTVYAVDHVPLELVHNTDAPGEDSIFAYLEAHAGRTVRYSVADIFPVVASQDVADHLQMDLGAAVLLLEHTHIDSNDDPVAATSAYIHPERLTFSVVRTYNDV